MVGVLGIDPGAPEWTATDAGPAAAALSALVDRLVEDRNAARSARDWAAADGLRDLLAASGVALEDGPTGTRWNLEGADHGR
jgi:cysteinyl-tRNA synthetase